MPLPIIGDNVARPHPAGGPRRAVAFVPLAALKILLGVPDDYVLLTVDADNETQLLRVYVEADDARIPKTDLGASLPVVSFAPDDLGAPS